MSAFCWTCKNLFLHILIKTKWFVWWILTNSFVSILWNHRPSLILSNVNGREMKKGDHYRMRQIVLILASCFKWIVNIVVVVVENDTRFECGGYKLLINFFDPPIIEVEIRCDDAKYTKERKKAQQISNLLFIFRLSFLSIACYFCCFFFSRNTKLKHTTLFGCLFIEPSYRVTDANVSEIVQRRATFNANEENVTNKFEFLYLMGMLRFACGPSS